MGKRLTISTVLTRTWHRFIQWSGFSGTDDSAEPVPEASLFRVLVVSAESGVAEYFALGLALHDYLHAVDSLDQALSSARQLVPNVALVDIDDDRLDGVAVAAALRPLCGGGAIFIALSRNHEHGPPQGFDFCIAPPAEPEQWPLVLANVMGGGRAP